MNFFENYVYNNVGRPISKWGHYFEIYEKHFSKFRNKEITLLEIGVGHGGSLQMWKSYFGDKCTVVGIDIYDECKKYEEERIKIEIGSQFDINTINNLISKYKSFDIIIDDGSHINEHMIFTFNNLFKNLNNEGIYFVEDVHTSYYPDYGGGLLKKDTFMEFVKMKMDEINMFYTDYDGAKRNFMTKHLNSVSIYDSVVVFEKKFRNYVPHTVISPGNCSNPIIDPGVNLQLEP